MGAAIVALLTPAEGYAWLIKEASRNAAKDTAGAMIAGASGWTTVAELILQLRDAGLAIAITIKR